MSGTSRCRCPLPRTVVVVHRRCNFSAFNGYRRTWSAYSLVRCTRCSHYWRTRASYVDSAPDAPAR